MARHSVALLALALSCMAGLPGCGDKPSNAPEAPGTAMSDIHEAEFTLSDEMRRFIWDAEHLSLVLGQDFLPIVRKAIRGEALDKMRSFLAADFEATLFTGAGETRTHGAITQERWAPKSAKQEKQRADGFMDWLSGIGRSLETVDKLAFHFTRLHPEVRQKLDGRWHAGWDLHVLGTRAGGVRVEYMLRCHLLLNQLNKSITDQQGWIERFETVYAWRVVSARPLMADVTSTTGIDVARISDNWKREGPPYAAVSGGLHAVDGNNDGRVDLLINDLHGFFYYEQVGDGRFEDRTKRAGLELAESEYVRSVAPGDFDNDGREDLILFTLKGDGSMGFRFYRNDADDGFTQVSTENSGLREMSLSGFDAAVADYDADGLIDIYVIKQGKPGPKTMKESRWLGDETSREGLLLKNLGNWRFVDATAAAGMGGKSIDAYGAVWFDHEPDGDPDLFLSNHMGPNVLWENQGNGTFKSLPMNQGFGGFSMGASAGDLDDDGDVDVYVANMYSSAGQRVMGHLRAEDYPKGWFKYIEGFVIGNELYRSQNDTLDPIGIQAEVDSGGWAYGPALVDLDGDGRLDIYSPAGFQSVTRGKPDG